MKNTENITVVTPAILSSIITAVVDIYEGGGDIANCSSPNFDRALELHSIVERNWDKIKGMSEFLIQFERGGAF